MSDNENPSDSDLDDSQRPVAALQASALEWSTIVAAGRGQTKKKACDLCGHEYAGGPALIRIHLDKTLKPREVAACHPAVNKIQRHNAVLAELRKRKQAKDAKEDIKRKRSASRAGMPPQKEAEKMQEYSTRPSEDEVTEACMRVIVKKALPLDLVDDLEFRRAIKKSCRAAQTYIDPKTQDVKLPHATNMTQKVLPLLDAKLEQKLRRKVEGLLQQCGCTVMSDDWSSVQARSIINALLTTPAGARFIEALDTSGETKDAEFIKEFICRIIEAIGPENVAAVCMDGACKASFDLITAVYPHVQCFICPTHSLDNFLKNVGSDKDKIIVKGEGEYVWGETTFNEPLSQVWTVIKFVTNHHKPLAVYRDIAALEATWAEHGKPKRWY